MPEKLKLRDEDAGRFDDIDLSDIVVEIEIPAEPAGGKDPEDNEK